MNEIMDIKRGAAVRSTWLRRRDRAVPLFAARLHHVAGMLDVGAPGLTKLLTTILLPCSKTFAANVCATCCAAG